MNTGIFTIETSTRGFRFGRIFIDEDYLITGRDEDSREFLGDNANAHIYDLVCEDQKQEMHEFLDAVAAGEKRVIICMLVDRYDKWNLVEIWGDASSDPDYKYELKVWNIRNLEDSFAYVQKNMWKYRVMLGLTSYILFDYDIRNNVLSFYRYVGKKSNRLFYGTLEEFETEIIKYSDGDQHCIDLINQFGEQMRNGANVIEITIHSGILHKQHKMQKLAIRGRYSEADGAPMIFGLVNNLSESEDDTPYYMTNAGLDSMTGLLNKRSLIEYSEDILTQEATASRTHYMVLLDIDDFKQINDNYGHQAGDKAIQMLACVLSDVIQEYGIAGRYGGDEFYLLTDLVETEDDLRRLLRLIRTKAEAKAKEVLGINHFTLSMGVARYPDVGKSYNDLLSLADKSLYIAKEKGKNRYIIYRPTMHEDVETGANRKGISTYDMQAKAINEAVLALFEGGADVIPSTLSDIVKNFDLDSVDVFFGADLATFCSEGKYPSGFAGSDFAQNKAFMEYFGSDCMMVMNNNAAYKYSAPEIYAFLQEKHCMSMIQVALPNPDEPEFLISFNTLNRIHKWNDAEISNLGLYGQLVYKVLKK